jgi:hypothetical protein
MVTQECEPGLGLGISHLITLVSPALRKLRQENLEIQASLGYRARRCLRRRKRKRR